jgi:curved DNA-binding protein CbpA
MKALHTHYDNLKVARNAPPEVIRAAYKILCQQFHPDRHGGHPRATQTFQLISAAYEVLSDPCRRRQHDEWIAKAEARDRARDTERAPARWNGRERRRRPSPHAATPTASRARPIPKSASSIAQRIPPHLRMLALWSSVALTGAMLILIYHL